MYIIMATKEKTVKLPSCLTYGVKHSRSYVPSLVTQFLDERDEKGCMLKRHSDIHLLLRQESLQRKIGVDALRRYFDQNMMNGNRSGTTDNLTDDQLFELIPLKEVNNLTTAYEWACYLSDNEKELKSRYESYKKTRDKQDAFTKWFKSSADESKIKDD